MRLDNCSQFLRDNRCFEIKHISYIYKKLPALFCLWYGVESYGCPIYFIIVHKPRADIAQHLFLAFWAQLGTLCRKSMSTARRTPQVGYNSHQNSLYPNCSYIKRKTETMSYWRPCDNISASLASNTSMATWPTPSSIIYWSITSSTTLVGSSVSAEMSVISCLSKSDKV